MSWDGRGTGTACAAWKPGRASHCGTFPTNAPSREFPVWPCLPYKTCGCSDWTEGMKEERAQTIHGGLRGGFEVTCRRNLMCYLEGKAIGDHGASHSGLDVCAFDHNFCWNASGKPVLFGKKRLAEWPASGQDRQSLIADPLFVDPKKGDFRRRPGSPAAQIGVEPWNFTHSGPRSRPAAGKSGTARTTGNAGYTPAQLMTTVTNAPTRASKHPVK